MWENDTSLPVKDVVNTTFDAASPHLLGFGSAAYNLAGEQGGEMRQKKEGGGKDGAGGCISLHP